MPGDGAVGDSAGSTALSALVARAAELVGPGGDAMRLVLLRLSRRRPEDVEAWDSVDRLLAPRET